MRIILVIFVHHSFKNNKLNCMFLDSGRKLELPEKSNEVGITYKITKVLLIELSPKQFIYINTQNCMNSDTL